MDFNNYYKILVNTKKVLEEMIICGNKKEDLILVLPKSWNEFLLDRKTLLGLDVKYYDMFDGAKTSVIISKKLIYYDFGIPNCEISNGELN